MPRVSFCFFFFQAEDGIRDGTVTGVQTCALPICCQLVLEVPETVLQQDGLRHLEDELAARHSGNPERAFDLLDERRVPRSEERRVGKECRSRWWRYH